MSVIHASIFAYMQVLLFMKLSRVLVIGQNCSRFACEQLFLKATNQTVQKEDRGAVTYDEVNFKIRDNVTSSCHF